MKSRDFHDHDGMAFERIRCVLGVLNVEVGEVRIKKTLRGKGLVSTLMKTAVIWYP